jgi:hypothetical protein
MVAVVMCESWVAMMRMSIDQTGNNFFALGVDHAVRRLRQHRRFAQGDNLAVAYRDIGVDESSRRPDFTVPNQQIRFGHEFPCSPRVKNLLYDRRLVESIYGETRSMTRAHFA